MEGETIGGPVSPDAWKRAVYRPPPAHFDVEMLSPEKQGGNYCFGMRICPIKDDTASDSSRGSDSEYVIWRRWEDCLCFQESLELEYSRMARAKRHRLVQGKGVKRNGIYIHDQAASFESLPNGPDPSSVAKDIHRFLPKLSKKGTIFRATQAAAEQRHKELQALVESLWSDSHPALIAELVESRTVTDFFGYWRRDSDLAAKQQKRRDSKPRDSNPRNSVTSSVFSMYFSSDSYSTSQLPTPAPSLSTSPRSASRFPQSLRRPSNRPHTSHGVSSLRETFVPEQPITPAETFLRLNRPTYPQSARSSEGSLYETSSHDSTPITSPVMMAQEVPVVFGHNSDYITNGHPSDRPLSPLQPLPEDYELKTPVTFVFGNDALSPVGRDSTQLELERQGQLFDSPPLSPVSSAETYRQPSRNDSARLSWQSATSIASSASSYLDGLDIALPVSPLDSCNRTRQSICSLSSIRTTSSANAIIPELSPTSDRISSRSDQRRSHSEDSRPMSISERGDWSECEDDSVYEYLHDFHLESSSPAPSVFQSHSPKTPLDHRFPHTPQHNNFSPLNITRPSTSLSIRTAMSSSSRATDVSSLTSPTRENTLTVKAAFNGSIVSFRVADDVAYDEVRRRMYEKFVNQEGIPLSEAFRIAYLLPASVIQTDHVDPARARSRSDSLASSGFLDHTRMRLVTSQVEWELVVANAGRAKISLRVIDVEANN